MLMRVCSVGSGKQIHLWLADRVAADTIAATTESRTLPFLGSRQHLDAEVARRFALMDAVVECIGQPDLMPPDDTFGEAWDGALWLESLRATADTWWAQFEEARARGFQCLFLHVCDFNDGYPPWMKRAPDSSMNVTLTTLTEFPADMRCRPGAVSIQLTALLTDAAEKELGLGWISEQRLIDYDSFAKGVYCWSSALDRPVFVVAVNDVRRVCVYVA
jgi:hypothetical protein